MAGSHSTASSTRSTISEHSLRAAEHRRSPRSASSPTSGVGRSRRRQTPPSTESWQRSSACFGLVRKRGGLSVGHRDHLVDVPPRGKAHQVLPASLGHRLQEGWDTRAPSPRFPPHRRPEPRARRRAPVHRHEDGRPSNREHLPALCDRGRGHAQGRRRETSDPSRHPTGSSVQCGVARGRDEVTTPRVECRPSHGSDGRQDWTWVER